MTILPIGETNMPLSVLRIYFKVTDYFAHSLSIHYTVIYVWELRKINLRIITGGNYN